MKSVVVFVLMLSIAGCVANDPEVSTQTSSLTEANTSTSWIPGGTCGATTCDGSNIWPSDLGITSVQVLYRLGPDRRANTISTKLAFVIWNSSVVGRIYRIDAGAAEADFRKVSTDIMWARTSRLPDSEAGSSGSAVGGPVPVPHPNVEGWLTFDSTYLEAVKRYASVIQSATVNFLATKAIGVDQ